MVFFSLRTYKYTPSSKRTEIHRVLIIIHRKSINLLEENEECGCTPGAILLVKSGFGCVAVISARLRDGVDAEVQHQHTDAISYSHIKDEL